ncbi:hypothetical protein SAMN02910275_01535 [Butyrivibrio sp. INlla18]|uniref:hypothetical protein n=1 Tax=Butyrivibrio sp. INlla18 TaxID=1520806 RepID=UPI000884E46B|nr:hypothetical protein [Butyrivibrio sp. INlla18]SDA60713.1 hypothetical protein SAMN02910275_01535 [Butyrivibrio sp. INlla18]
MNKIVFTFNNEIAKEINSKAKGKNNLDASMYARNGATSEVTIDNDQIREVIKGEEGVFKDVSNNITEIGKIQKTDEFIFLQAGDYVYSVKRNSFTEGSEEELFRLIKNGNKGVSKNKTKENKQDTVVKFDRKAQQQYWQKINKDNAVKRKVPLAQRFRLPLMVGMMGMLLSTIEILDPFNHMGDMAGNPITLASLANIPLSGIAGFMMGFLYVFFIMWFENQKESVRVTSIVLFPLTITVFALISFFGTIPYIIYLLIKKDEGYGAYKVVNVAVKIAYVLVGVLFLISIIALIAFRIFFF